MNPSADSALKRVVLLTAMKFWHLGAGAYVRDVALLWHLGQETALTVVYAGDSVAPTNGEIEQLGLPIRFVALSDGSPMTQATKIARLRSYCAQHAVDVCLVDRVELAYLLDALNPGTRTFLDTHDVPGDAIAGLTTEEERLQGLHEWDAALRIYRRFDRVVAIQERDYRRLSEALGADRIVLAPHPATLPAVAQRPQARRIGFVASAWKYNVEGLAWLLRDVWPRLIGLDIELHLYGHICKALEDRRAVNVYCHGFVLDLASIYRSLDVVINPIRRGSGLKIKTVEAISSGLPLVTTSEGARGLESLAGRCFLVADDSPAFSDAIRRIVVDQELRACLARTAAAYARDHMSAERCLGSLIDQVLE